MNWLQRAWLRFCGRLPGYTVYYGSLHAAQLREEFDSLDAARAFADDLERRGAKCVFIGDCDGCEVPRHADTR